MHEYYVLTDVIKDAEYVGSWHDLMYSRLVTDDGNDFTAWFTDFIIMLICA